MRRLGPAARPGLVFVALLAFVAACSPNATQTPGSSQASAPGSSGGVSTPEATDAGGPKVGGSLTIGQIPILGLDPITNITGPTHIVQSQIYSALVTLDNNLDPIPDLAESWDSTSPTEWVFKLRKGAMWQDDNEIFAKGQSREITADDVKFAYDTYRDPAVASGKADYLASVETITVVDPYTVKLTLSAPNAFLFIDTGIPGVPIFPREAYEKWGVEGMATNAVGSGPFKVKEYVADDHLTLVRNDLYWIKPNLDEVVFKFIPDENVRVAAIRNGELDVVWLIPLKDEVFFTDPQFQVYYTYGDPGERAESASLFSFYFNTEAAPFDDVNVRTAFVKATDRAAVASQVWGENGIPVYSVTGEGMVGYNPALKDTYGGTDIEAAKQLLDAAGWIPGDDGIRVKDGTRLSVPVTMTQTYKEYETATLVLADQLKAAGIELTVDAAAGSIQVPRMRAGEIQMMIINASGGVQGLRNVYHSTSIGGANFSRINDPEIDGLIDQAWQEFDAGKRGELLKEAEEKGMAYWPILPISRVPDKGVHLATVHDFPAANLGLGLVNSVNNTWKD